MGQEIDIPVSETAKFTPSSVMKDAISGSGQRE